MTTKRRTPQVMFDLILNIAQANERIRGVYLNGSRANPKVASDGYQDFDIVYVVTDTLPFIQDRGWIHRFGELAIVQEPDRMDQLLGKPSVDFSKQYAWLMLFKDGNRIDLTLVSVEQSTRHIMTDKLTVVLLDKDHRFPALPEPSDADYHVKRPSRVEFSACTNEFWWCLNNVGKGIVRDEIPYALAMFNEVVRPMLNRMVDWWIGINTSFAVNPGKYGKFYKNLLSDQHYHHLLRTYCNSQPENIWDAVFSACELFTKLSDDVAQHLSFELDESEGQNILDYLRTLHRTEH